MVNFLDLRNNLLKILNTNKLNNNYKYIVANPNAPKPPYPFATINLGVNISSTVNLNKTWENFNDITIKKTHHDQPILLTSFQFYSNDSVEAMQMALNTSGQIQHALSEELSKHGIIIVEVRQVQDRTSPLEDLYQEYKYGFDVRFRVDSTVDQYSTKAEGAEVSGEI